MQCKGTSTAPSELWGPSRARCFSGFWEQQPLATHPLTNGALMGKSSFNGRISIRILNKIMTLSKSV